MKIFTSKGWREKINKKILLIEPPFYRLFKNTYSIDRVPLSSGYLSCMIKRKTDWQVLAYNSDFCPRNEFMKTSYMTQKGFDHYLENLNTFSAEVWKETRSTIKDYEPGIIGISAKSQNFRSACIVAKLAKEINGDIITIVGGPHVSMVGRDVLDCPDIDIAVQGEGEDTIVELLNAIDNDKELNGIKGIIYRDGKQVIENAKREYIEDLDTLCFPNEVAAETLKDYNLYSKDKFSYIIATRGCPYNCFFCGSRNIWSRRVRYRSCPNVIAEIKTLQNKGLQLVNFVDDTFGVTDKYLKDLCNALILHSPRIRWSCEIHVNLVNEETISLMKKAGCCSIRIGIESGNNEILNQMRKGFTIEKAFKAVDIIKKNDIKVQAFFMAGFPQETYTSLNDTMNAIKRIHCDEVTFSIFTPYLGTEAFEFCKKEGTVDSGFDVSLYNHLSPANYFCPRINRKQFRKMISEIEKIVDVKNVRQRMRSVFSFKKILRIKELGLVESMRRAVRIFTAR